MKTMLVGALGMFALQVLLVGSYLVVDSQDPIILDPESGSLEEDGLTMVMLCGEGHTPEGRLSEVLSKMPPDGDGARARAPRVASSAPPLGAPASPLSSARSHRVPGGTSPASSSRECPPRGAGPRRSTRRSPRRRGR